MYWYQRLQPVVNEEDDMFKLNLSLLKWWRHLLYRQNNSQKQFEQR